MGMKKKKILGTIIYHILVAFGGFIMVYPLLWMIFSSFKETSTIFTTASQLIPDKFIVTNYINGMKGFSKVPFYIFFKNSAVISITSTFGTVASSALVAYAFSRCKFPGRGILFAAVLATMMLPAQIMMIPQYLWYKQLGWVGTYFPMILPYFFAIQGFFVYQMTNFIDGIPRELDEAAKIDGCSYYGIFVRVILPLAVPVLTTSAIMSFIWRWDDYLSALLYIQETAKYPSSIALKLFSDPGSSSDYGAMFAMATLSITPAMVVFFIFQRWLVEGISTSGLKG